MFDSRLAEQARKPDAAFLGAGVSDGSLGPKADGTYVIEFSRQPPESARDLDPRTETAVIRHFQELMPYGLFVPDVP